MGLTLYIFFSTPGFWVVKRYLSLGKEIVNVRHEESYNRYYYYFNYYHCNFLSYCAKRGDRDQKA